MSLIKALLVKTVFCQEYELHAWTTEVSRKVWQMLTMIVSWSKISVVSA